MDVGMISQVAGPGMQNANHANITAQKARIVRQLLRRLGRSAKEQVVEQPLMAAGEGT